jgi:hypothetical protein
VQERISLMLDGGFDRFQSDPADNVSEVLVQISKTVDTRIGLP